MGSGASAPQQGERSQGVALRPEGSGAVDPASGFRRSRRESDHMPFGEGTDAVADGYWEVEDQPGTNEWKQYTEDNSLRLEAAFRNHQQECSVLVAGRLYTVKFNAMEQVSGSGVARRIRRRLVVPAGEVLSPSKKRVGKLVTSVEGHLGAVYCCAFSADGTRFATGGRDATLKLWDSSDYSLLRSYSLTDGFVLSTAFNPNRAQLASGGGDSVVRLVDTKEFDRNLSSGSFRQSGGQQQGVAVDLRGHKGRVYTLSYTLDGRQLLSSGTDGIIYVWDIAALKAAQVRRHSINDVSLFCVRTANLSKDLAVAGGDDKALKLFDLRCDPTLPPSMEYLGGHGHTETIWGCGLSSDDTLAASCGMDGRVLVWDVRSNNKPLREMYSKRRDDKRCPTHAVEFLPDNRLLTAARNHRFSVWQSMGDYTASTEATPSEQPLAAVDKKEEAEGLVQVQQEQQQHLEEPIAEVRAHQGNVLAATYHPANGSIMTCSMDGSVRFWTL